MEHPLRTLHMSHAASIGAPTGAEKSLLLLASGLLERGHDVHAVQPARGALAEAWEQARIPVEFQPCRQCWLSYWEDVAWPKAAYKWFRCLLPDPGLGGLREIIRRVNPDVVHVNCVTHITGAKAARLESRPVVWHLREILPAGARRRWFAGQLESADAIVVVSEAVAEWVRAEGLGDRVHVIHNGVEVQAPNITQTEALQALGLKTPSEHHQGWIGFLGQLVPHKGPLEFLKAAELALKDAPGLSFFLAGAGPAAFREKLAAHIQASEFQDRLHLLPPQPDGRRLVAAADCVCLPTLTPDPFPRSVLEGMGYAKPIVGFVSGGAPEMVSNGVHGRLVPSGDLEALAQAFVDIGANPDLRERMGSAGRARAIQEFSIERHIQLMEQLFYEVASR